MQKSRSSTAVPRMVQLPSMARTRSHTLEPGMICQHAFLTDEKWHILNVREFWCMAERHGVKQSFPCDAMIPLPSPKLKPSRVVRMAKAAKKAAEGPDEIAQALMGATTLNLLWQIAGKLGVPNDKRTRADKSHLNPGLQRMWIGNQARKLKGKS